MLVGKGPVENQLRKLADRLRITPRVQFHGAIPFQEVANFAAAADLFVFPSQIETQGLVLVEAMAAGTPVVAVDCPSSRDALASGGGVLAAASVEDFALAVTGLLEDTERLQSLGSEARKIAKNYDIPSATQKLIEVYNAAIERNAAMLQRVA